MNQKKSEWISEDLDHQLKKLAQVMKEQEKEEQEQEKRELQTPEQRIFDLEAQIAEDQALEKSRAESLNAEDAKNSEMPHPLPVLSSLDMNEIQSCLEALLFMSDKPISLEKFKIYLGLELNSDLLQEALLTLVQRYQGIHHGFELLEINDGYQFRTKPGRASLAQKLAKVQIQRLSSGAMESLAIIAYKQPILKEEIDKIRGVDSSYFIRGLLEKKLIQITGRSELPGRPLLYSTTPDFLELFGLKDLFSLPSLRELEQMIPGSQSQNPEDAEEKDPRIREMRRLVGQMKADHSSDLHYNPKEDDKILKEIREKVSSIPTSTPYLEELKAAELLALQPADVPPSG